MSLIKVLVFMLVISTMVNAAEFGFAICDVEAPQQKMVNHEAVTVSSDDFSFLDYDLTKLEGFLNVSNNVPSGGNETLVLIFKQKGEVGKLMTKDLTSPVYYLHQIDQNKYEIKNDLRKGWLVDWHVSLDAGSYKGVIKVKRYYEKRPEFPLVPSWKVAKPEILSRSADVKNTILHNVGWTALAAHEISITNDDGSVTKKLRIYYSCLMIDEKEGVITPR